MTLAVPLEPRAAPAPELPVAHGRAALHFNFPIEMPRTSTNAEPVVRLHPTQRSDRPTVTELDGDTEASSVMSEPIEDHPGRILSGRYELVEPLGKGGMAVVWRGTMHGADGFRRAVAIKRIDPSCRGFLEVLEMFVEEARVGGQLQHPNIVQVYDFGADETGERYLVTELVRGPHLGQWLGAFLANGTLPPWEMVTAIGVEVLRALDAAHFHTDGNGRNSPILHRDVTPGNILLDVSGVVKLADFGLARATDRGQITRPNTVKGKLSYLAPESLQGGPPSVATDLFSLGIVLWEALTGKRLFHAERDIDVVELVKHCRIPLLSREKPSLPLGLCATVHRALDRSPPPLFLRAQHAREHDRGAARAAPLGRLGRARGQHSRRRPDALVSRVIFDSPHWPARVWGPRGNRARWSPRTAWATKPVAVRAAATPGR